MKFNEFRQLRPKGNPNVLVFVCEDDFLVEESRAVWAENFGPNWVFEKVHAKEFDDIPAASLMDEAQTPSLFSQNRVLMVGNAEKVSKSRGEELQALQNVRNSSLRIILLCSGGKALEGKRKHHGGRMMAGRMMAMSRMADTNNDGSVSQSELNAAAMKRFDMMDTNKDGGITTEERQAGRKRMKAEWQRAGANKSRG